MTTRTGRVVYTRRPHLFRYSDALRILKKLEVNPKAFSLQSLPELLAAVRSMREISRDLLAFVLKSGVSSIPLADLRRLLESLVDFILAIAARGPAELADLVMFRLFPQSKASEPKLEEKEVPNNGGEEG